MQVGRQLRPSANCTPTRAPSDALPPSLIADLPPMPPSKKAKIDSDADASAAKLNTAGANAAAAGQGVIPRSDTPRAGKPSDGLTFVHWNVAGLGALLKSEERQARLKRLIAEESPDVLAISEHKLSTEKHPAAAAQLGAMLPGYKIHWAVCTAKNGYSGVAALVKREIKVESVEIDSVGSLNEGRTITLELGEVCVVAAYAPNSGQKLDRLDYRIRTWEARMREHLAELREAKRKPLALIGDLNVAHLDADIWNVEAKHVPKSAGTTPAERAAFGQLLEQGYVDAFRALHPDATGCFSYWSTRSGGQLLNRGLRLDYAVISTDLVGKAEGGEGGEGGGGGGGGGSLVLHDAAILKEFAPNGDHAPTLVALRRTG